MDAEQARAHAERGRALLQRLNHLEAISDPPAVDNFTSSPCGTTLRDGLVEEERKPPPFVSARARAPPAIAQMESGHFVEERELWVPGVGFCSAPAGRWKRCDDAVRRSSTQGRTAQTEKSHRFLAVAPPILDGMGWRIDVASVGAARACDDLGWERCRRRSGGAGGLRLKRVRRWTAVADDRRDSPRGSDATDRAGGLVWCAARDASDPLSLAIGISVPLRYAPCLVIAPTPPSPPPPTPASWLASSLRGGRGHTRESEAPKLQLRPRLAVMQHDAFLLFRSHARVGATEPSLKMSVLVGVESTCVTAASFGVPYEEAKRHRWLRSWYTAGSDVAAIALDFLPPSIGKSQAQRQTTRVIVGFADTQERSVWLRMLELSRRRELMPPLSQTPFPSPAEVMAATSMMDNGGARDDDGHGFHGEATGEATGESDGDSSPPPPLPQLQRKGTSSLKEKSYCVMTPGEVERHIARSVSWRGRQPHGPTLASARPVGASDTLTTVAMGNEGEGDREASCMVCFESLGTDSLLALGCGHAACRECWTHYLEEKARSGLAAATTLCLAPRCEVSVPPSAFDELLPTDLASRARRMRTEVYVRAHDPSLFSSQTVPRAEDSGAATPVASDSQTLMRWCSQPGCGRAIMVSLKQNNDVSGGSLQWQQRDIRCGCGAFWCFRCGAPAHRPATCAVAAVWRRKVESDARNEPAEPDESTATRRWLREFTKPCPGCHDPIEKNQGCNHMTCSSCHFEFCWVCMDPWSSHGEQSGGFYRCLIVDETVTASRLEELWRRHNDGDHTTAVTMTADEEARLKAGSAERKRHSAHEQALHEAASARVNVYASAATRNRVRSVSMVSSSTASMSVDGGIEKLGEATLIASHAWNALAFSTVVASSLPGGPRAPHTELLRWLQAALLHEVESLQDIWLDGALAVLYSAPGHKEDSSIGATRRNASLLDRLRRFGSRGGGSNSGTHAIATGASSVAAKALPLAELASCVMPVARRLEKKRRALQAFGDRCASAGLLPGSELDHDTTSATTEEATVTDAATRRETELEHAAALATAAVWCRGLEDYQSDGEGSKSEGSARQRPQRSAGRRKNFFVTCRKQLQSLGVDGSGDAGVGGAASRDRAETVAARIAALEPSRRRSPPPAPIVSPPPPAQVPIFSPPPPAQAAEARLALHVLAPSDPVGLVYAGKGAPPTSVLWEWEGESAVIVELVAFRLGVKEQVDAVAEVRHENSGVLWWRLPWVADGEYCVRVRASGGERSAAGHSARFLVHALGPKPTSGQRLSATSLSEGTTESSSPLARDAWWQGYDSTREQLYWYNAATGRSQWHEPNAPFQPYAPDDDGENAGVRSSEEADGGHGETKEADTLKSDESGGTSTSDFELFDESGDDGTACDIAVSAERSSPPSAERANLYVCDIDSDDSSDNDFSSMPARSERRASRPSSAGLSRFPGELKEGETKVEGDSNDGGAQKYEWFQGYDSNYESFYWFNVLSQQSQWHEPNAPFAPYAGDDHFDSDEGL